MKVFVQLPAHISITDWHAKYSKGHIIGVNDPESPYGYARVKKFGHDVKFSTKPKHFLVCRIFRKIFGFDFWNVFLHRRKIFESDVVWTHTEYECFAVALLCIIFRKNNKILGQCIWLLDKWDSIGFLRKKLFKILIRRIDILTFHSPLNAELAEKYFNHKNIHVVKFGIPDEKKYFLSKKYDGNMLNIVAIGNDIHRDWEYLVSCCGSKSNIHLTVISTTIDKKIVEPYSNVIIKTFDLKEDFLKYIGKMDLSIVPLKENLHASGLTAIQESIILGVPVLCSQVGGLEYYFNDDVLTFFKDDLSETLDDVLLNYSSYGSKVIRAQEYLYQNGINADTYISSQIALSLDILEKERT